METPSGSKRLRLDIDNSSGLESSDDEGASLPESTEKDLKNKLNFDPKKLRHVMDICKGILDRDSVFGRTRLTLASELDLLIQNTKKLDSLDSDELYCFYEQMDDTLDALVDLDDAHLAVLRHNALQLSKFSQLEVLSADEGTVEEQENEEVQLPDTSTLPAARKIKRKNIEDNVKVPKTKKKDDCNSNASTKQIASAKVELDASEPRTKRNGLTKVDKEINHRKNSIIEVRNGKKREKSIETSIKEESDNQKTANESDEDESDDDKEDEVSDFKRITRRTPGRNERNGNNDDNSVKKNKKIGGRQKKASTPESEKPKRRAAAMAAAASVQESIGRSVGQRRGKLNAESNHDEQTYCLCDQISYGQMIGCDNQSCSIEWFHFECVDVKVKPGKGVKWFCPLCRGDKSTLLKPGLRR